MTPVNMNEQALYFARDTETGAMLALEVRSYSADRRHITVVGNYELMLDLGLRKFVTATFEEFQPISKVNSTLVLNGEVISEQGLTALMGVATINMDHFPDFVLRPFAENLARVYRIMRDPAVFSAFLSDLCGEPIKATVDFHDGVERLDRKYGLAA